MTSLLILAVACLVLWCLYLQARIGDLLNMLRVQSQAQADQGVKNYETDARLLQLFGLHAAQKTAVAGMIDRRQEQRRNHDEPFLPPEHRQGIDRRGQGPGRGHGDPMAGRDKSGLPDAALWRTGAQPGRTILTPQEAAQAQALLEAAGHAPSRDWLQAEKATLAAEAEQRQPEEEA